MARPLSIRYMTERRKWPTRRFRVNIIGNRVAEHADDRASFDNGVNKVDISTT